MNSNSYNQTDTEEIAGDAAQQGNQSKSPRKPVFELLCATIGFFEI
jgi:hypothetical protein